MIVEAPIDRLECAVYRIPTDMPEGDGTFEWNATTMVVVNVYAGGSAGNGYTYTDASAAHLITGALQDLVVGSDAFDVEQIGCRMWRAVRNCGRSGIAACAISAVDLALWDLKARLLDTPLCRLLGQVRESVPVYGSGGFTTYSDDLLCRQLSRWVNDDGCRFVKMKVGAEPERDPQRIRSARSAIGDAELFIDANGAFTPSRSVRFADAIRQYDVRWFEEPVSSDDEAGLRFVRQSTPSSMEVAAGEYVFNLDDVRRLLSAGAVDVLQADATRCGGISGFLKIAALAEAFHQDLSCHCGPGVHLHVACATAGLRHIEWFHDHVLIEQMLIDGAPQVVNGAVRPDLSRPGNGFRFKDRDAEPYRI
ncbi:enolase C-terminal domain-like protein [Mycoplana dimorpha]|uniref:L-alanine-DL-glutamate epimerase-like enolase superfamily enzyme n=1 Tax=Mycoplana dimorpha TaxID=28320 RepID=A0A2T5AJR3_MYCDI|nr:enolase C-terminal domain-like protein [Mycoplana dimorpha]PTM86950.1 L-alanine-DL-glutamate epimerase-like enolase superfamily enzyme [Mycoplana dimorpha]